MSPRSKQTWATSQSSRKDHGGKDLNAHPRPGSKTFRVASIPEEKIIKIRMPMVRPGSETGVYVMPIGNLPWNVTWQDLKDFARDPKDGQGLCDIEHAEVYTSVKNSKQKSAGHGYIKVRGETDFWRAYNYLNGRAWKGLCLQPDCRNAWISIPVGDAQIGTRTATEPHGSSTASSRRPSTSVESVARSLTTWQTQPITDQTALPHSQVDLNWARGYYEANAQMQPPQYNYQQVGPPSQQYPQYSTAGNMPNQAVTHTPEYPPPDTVYLTIPVRPHYTYVAPNMAQSMGGYQVSYTPAYHPGAEHQLIDQQLNSPMSNMTHQPSNDQQLNPYMSNMTLQSSQEPMVETEARKIHIGNLPSSFRSEDLKKFLAMWATKPPGQDHEAVEKLELPMQHDPPSSSSSARKRRGHAFATFKNSNMAMNCIDALNGGNFKGKKLELKLTKEGVARARGEDPQYLMPAAATRSGASSSRGHHGRRRSGSTGRGSESGRSSQASGIVSEGSAVAVAEVIHRGRTPMVVDSSYAQ